MALLTALEEFLGVEKLDGMVTELAEDANAYPAIDLFERYGLKLGLGQDAEGNEVVCWDRDINTRDLPPLGTADAPSIQVSTGGRGQRFETMAHVAISEVIPVKALLRTRALGELTPNAPKMLDRAVKKLVAKVMRAKNLFATRILTPAGVVSTVFPGSDVAYTLAAPEILTNAIVAAQSISDPTTRFLSSNYTGSLHSIADAMNNRSAYDPDLILARRKFYTAFRGLNEINALADNSSVALDQLRRGPLANAFNGIGNIENWWRWEQFFQTLSGVVNPTKTAVKYLPEEDDLIALPPLEELTNVLGWAMGTQDIPESAYGYEAAESLVAMNGQKEGIAVYAYDPDPDPVRIKIVCRCSFFYYPINPDAVQYVSDVVAGDIS